MPFDNIDIPESPRTRALKRARKLVDAGWIPGMLSDGKGGYCALGAVDEAAATGLAHREAISLLARYATYVGRDTYNNCLVGPKSSHDARVAAHNNMLGRERTLDMFDAAIAESIRLDAVIALV